MRGVSRPLCDQKCFSAQIVPGSGRSFTICAPGVKANLDQLRTAAVVALGW